MKLVLTLLIIAALMPSLALAEGLERQPDVVTATTMASPASTSIMPVDCKALRERITAIAEEKFSQFQRPLYLVQETPSSAIFESELRNSTFGESFLGGIATGRASNQAKTTVVLRFKPSLNGQCGHISINEGVVLNPGSISQYTTTTGGRKSETTRLKQFAETIESLADRQLQSELQSTTQDTPQSMGR